MAHQTPIYNPFMLMLNPEVVLAAVEKSERLGRLNRQLCRPLDRPQMASAAATRAGDDGVDEDDDGDFDDNTSVTEAQ
ncbi:MAG: hypothetical protein WAQ05_26895 [Rubrivivax sp.]